MSVTITDVALVVTAIVLVWAKLDDGQAVPKKIRDLLSGS